MNDESVFSNLTEEQLEELLNPELVGKAEYDALAAENERLIKARDESVSIETGFQSGWDACAAEMEMEIGNFKDRAQEDLELLMLVAEERDQWLEQAEILADALKLYRNDGIVAREVYAEFEQWKAGMK